MIWELLKKTSKNSRNSLIRKKSVSKNIDNAFWQADGNWSTTTDWRRIIFVFQDGKKIIIENSDDIPNYLYTPGIINFEGLKFRSNSIFFGRNIDEIMKGQFSMKSHETRIMPSLRLPIICIERNIFKKRTVRGTSFSRSQSNILSIYNKFPSTIHTILYPLGQAIDRNPAKTGIERISFFIETPKISSCFQLLFLRIINPSDKKNHPGTFFSD